MRERLRELGGTLEIQSDATGTTVIAAVPVNKTLVKSL
jgi:signal transduction histidine kinase